MKIWDSVENKHQKTLTFFVSLKYTVPGTSRRESIDHFPTFEKFFFSNYILQYNQCTYNTFQKKFPLTDS